MPSRVWSCFYVFFNFVLNVCNVLRFINIDGVYISKVSKSFCGILLALVPFSIRDYTYFGIDTYRFPVYIITLVRCCDYAWMYMLRQAFYLYNLRYYILCLWIRQHEQGRVYFVKWKRWTETSPLYLEYIQTMWIIYRLFFSVPFTQ